MLVAAVAVVAYALASRVWPATLAANELSNRLGAPFHYWNAVGTTAALAVPGLLWLGSRRTGHALGRALAYPAMGACILAILLTQSRGALRRRRARRGRLVRARAAAAAQPAGAARARRVRRAGRRLGALARPVHGDPPAARRRRRAWPATSACSSCSWALVLLLAGLVINAGLGRAPVPVRARRLTGLVAVLVALAVPLVGLTSVVFSDRGLAARSATGSTSWSARPTGTPRRGANRFTATSSTRGKYWREARRVFEDRPLLGVGAGAFEVARLRHRTDAAVTRHAHGFGVQTLADLGLLGAAAVALALLIAWLAAAARTTGLYPRGCGVPSPALERRDWDRDRTALVALALMVLAFGLQSAIDWTWFVPGPAVDGARRRRLRGGPWTARRRGRTRRRRVRRAGERTPSPRRR